jgi:hypothetical protein
MDQMTLFLVLGGLLILTLMVASIAQRYHAYLEERRRRVEQILQKVRSLEDILFRMQGLPVPMEAETVLRRDIVSRLKALRGVHAGHPGINQMITGAEQALAGTIQSTAALDLDEIQFTALQKSLGEVIWMAQEGRFSVELSPQESAALVQACTMRRAECLVRFHRREGERMRKERQLNQAQWHFSQISSFLREHGPNVDQVREWVKEAEEIYRQISGEISGQAEGSSSE